MRLPNIYKDDILNTDEILTAFKEAKSLIYFPKTKIISLWKNEGTNLLDCINIDNMNIYNLEKKIDIHIVDIIF